MDQRNEYRPVNPVATHGGRRAAALATEAPERSAWREWGRFVAALLALPFIALGYVCGASFGGFKLGVEIFSRIFRARKTGV